jgi:hypothetical protein
MADDTTLTPERLAELLARLDEVMTDAARLRSEITRQLSDQQRTVQQKVTRTRSRRARSLATTKRK